MKRDSYSDQQSRASFQPRSPQPAIEPSQLGQPLPHSSSTSNSGSNWLNKASGWVANKFQTAQNFVNRSGDAIAPDQILPALRGTASPNQPLVGVIDSGFGGNEHGSKMVEAIQKENPQAQIWKGGGVGAGGGLKSLVEFVDTAKATGHTQAVANLSFDLTEVHSDGSISTRSQLTAEEQSALTYARDNGVLVVASSGNQGGAMSALGQASQPSDNLIVVGAANGQDRASYSSYGRGLDLVAEDGSAGTSFAAAKVTSTIANIWSANSELSSQQVNQILTASATDLKTPGWDAETGAGLLNSTGAIDLATHTTPESIVFSGAQLMQQVPGSLAGVTWESRDGSVASERTAGFGDWLKQNAHGVLDVAGFVPGVGAVADLANAGLYAAEGDYGNAALSAAAAVPGIGDAAAAAKLATRGVRAVQAANRGARATERVASAARAIPSRPHLSSPPAPRPASPSRATRPGGGSSLSPGGRSAAPRPTSLSRSRRPESGRPPAAPGRRQPASDRPGSSGASRRPDSTRRQEHQPVAISSRRPSPKPQERRPGVGTGNRPATRREPNHQPELGATRRPQSTRPESNPRSSRSGALDKPRVEQPTANRVPSGFRRNRDEQLTQSRNSGQGRQSEPRARENQKPDGFSSRSDRERRQQISEHVFDTSIDALGSGAEQYSGEIGAAQGAMDIASLFLGRRNRAGHPRGDRSSGNSRPLNTNRGNNVSQQPESPVPAHTGGSDLSPRASDRNSRADSPPAPQRGGPGNGGNKPPRKPPTGGDGSHPTPWWEHPDPGSHYVTDKQGRTILAMTRIDGPHPGRKKADISGLARPGMKPGDHRGHLGPENLVDNPDRVNTQYNITAESPTSNLSVKKVLENLTRDIKLANPDSKIFLASEPLYRGTGERPVAFTHSVMNDKGEILHEQTIFNKNKSELHTPPNQGGTSFFRKR
jgi:hypothetical protein